MNLVRPFEFFAHSDLSLFKSFNLKRKKTQEMRRLTAMARPGVSTAQYATRVTPEIFLAPDQLHATYCMSICARSDLCVREWLNVSHQAKTIIKIRQNFASTERVSFISCIILNHNLRFVRCAHFEMKFIIHNYCYFFVFANGQM